MRFRIGVIGALAIATGSFQASLAFAQLGNAPASGGGKLEASAPSDGPDGAMTTDTDPELMALGRAERALFPQALRGVRPQFSFEAEGDWSSFGTTDAAAEGRGIYRSIELPQIFPNVDGRILTYLDFYRLHPQGKAILRAWAKRRGRYERLIEASLVKAGLPRELVWQSLVESSHNPAIRSPAGAAGLWQLMPDTARYYGLVVDRWLDERLDPERSTEAATKMMADLYQRFGNWELALAAYNMGEGGLLRTIRKYNTNDFWTLARYEAGLPWETALYVPRIVALTIAMSNPKVFGIEDVDADDSIAIDTVVLAPGQPLTAVARAVEVSLGQLKQLNPQLLTGRLPPTVTASSRAVRVFVPRGKGELVRSRLSRGQALEPDLESYALRRGETVDSLATARGITVELVRSINQIGDGEKLDPGTVLLLPRASQESTGQNGTSEQRVAIVPPDVVVRDEQRRVFYQVSSGDTLSSVADSFGITRAELLEVNSLDPSAKLQPNMLLSVLLPKTAKPKAPPYFEEAEVKVLTAGSDGFLDYFEGLRGNERILVQAKASDTLTSIGARYGVSAGTMERINRRSRREALREGQTVVVYVRRAAEPERVGANK